MGLSLFKKHKKTGNLIQLLRIQDIQDDMLLLQKGGTPSFVAVLSISPVNFTLMSQREQEEILEGFRLFLHRINIQEQISIHARILPYDLTPYLSHLQELQYNAPLDEIRRMAESHENFVKALGNRGTILRREFYLRIEHTPEVRKYKRRLAPEEIHALAKSHVDRVCELYIQDLGRCNLSATRLDNLALARYYESCIHAHYAEQHPLPEILLEGAERPPIPLLLSDISDFSPDLEKQGEQEEQSEETMHPQEDQITSTGSQETEKAVELTLLQESPTRQKGKRKKKTKQAAPFPTPYSTVVELLQPASLEVYKNYIKIQQQSPEYFRARCVVGYPAQVIAGWLDHLIQLDEPYIDIVLNIETCNPQLYLQSLSRKIASHRATQLVDARAGRTENPYIAAALVDVENLRDKIVRQEERVHRVSLYIASRAATLNELKARDEKVHSSLHTLDIKSVELALEHLYAWQGVLPEGRDPLKRGKILDTSTVVTAFPFASSSLSTETGALVGTTPNGSLVIIDPTSDSLDNGHEIIFARSGAGKSFAEKVRLMRHLLLGLECIVIDPEGEYLPICQQFGGVSIRLSSGRLQINPFDLPVGDKERNLLEEKFQSLLTLFDLMLAERDTGTLSQKEKAYLNKCFMRVYNDRGITSDPATHIQPPPNMQDLYTVIANEVCGADLYDLGDRLLRHLPAFPEKTEVDLNSAPLIVFNIRDLADDLRPAALFLITDFVWTQVRRERVPRARILTIDEAWTLLQFPEGGRFLSGMSRRARKYNLSLRVISQDVEDFLASEQGRTVLKNAYMKFLMKQDPTTIDVIASAFKLSEEERKFLLTCQRGAGLFFCGLSHIPLYIEASEEEYTLATTNPQELLREQAHKDALRYQAEQRKQQEAIEQHRNEYQVILPEFFTRRTPEEEHIDA